MYMYPENLRAQATLFFWRLKDLVVIGVLLLMSALIVAGTGFIVPLAATAAYAFLCIRIEENSIKEFMKYAVRYFIIEQQTFKWGLAKLK